MNFTHGNPSLCRCFQCDCDFSITNDVQYLDQGTEGSLVGKNWI